MPMSMKDAVSYSRYLSEIFAPFMPFPYMYEGESSNELSGIQEFVKRTIDIVKEWQQYQPENKKTTLLQLITNKQNSWYNLSEETNLSPVKNMTMRIKNKKMQISDEPFPKFSGSSFFESGKKKKELDITDSTYGEEKINFLLKLFLEPNKNIELLDAMSATQLSSKTLTINLRDRLIQRTLQTSNNEQIKGITIIPLNLNTNHWSLLIIEYNKNFFISNVMFVDPFGNAPPTAITKAISTIEGFEKETVNYHPIQFQINDFNCGLWIIAIAHYYSKEKHLPENNSVVNIEEKRRLYDEIWEEKTSSVPSEKKYSKFG